MKLVLDTHMHTIASGHAYGTIREMAKAASDKKLELIGISEHGPGIPGTCSTIYFHGLDKVPEYIDGVRVLHGCELNLDNDGNLLLEDIRYKKLDYLIVGIHCVNDLYTDQGIEKNTDNLIKCMTHPMVYMVSHPDTNKTPLDYERLVRAAKENNVALEVNNSSLVSVDRRPGCVENYKKMLAECNKQRCNIIINSDAHDPSWVGEYSLAKKLVEESGIDEELVLNTSKEKFLSFIGKAL